MTQSQLAERAGLSEETIGGIERLKYSPNLETLEKIASVFHLRLHELLRLEERKSASPFEEKLAKITGSLRTRSLEDLELAEDLLERIFERLDRK